VRSQLAARTRPLCQFVFLRSKVCYALLSASPRGYALSFATVAVIGPDWLLPSKKILPMLGTLRAGTPVPAAYPPQSHSKPRELRKHATKTGTYENSTKTGTDPILGRISR
jgi:hypothetical protein